jgi:hypothetical protein
MCGFSLSMLLLSLLHSQFPLLLAWLDWMDWTAS